MTPTGAAPAVETRKRRDGGSNSQAAPWLAPLVALAGFAWCLPGILCARGFWMADETRYAEVLRQMVDKGHWLVPHLNGFFYPDKPPLYFWLCAGLSMLTGGITPWACLLVTGLCAAAWLAVCFQLARDMFGTRAALFSVGVMMSNLLFLSCAQIVRMDAMMALFVALALYAFYRWTRNDRRGTLVLSHVFAGLAVLSKGPLGFAFAFLPGVAYLAHQRNWRRLRHFAAPLYLLIPLCLGGGWLVVAWFAGHQDFVRGIFVDQLAGRSVGGHAVHAEPFYFYALALLPVLLPWAPFVPRAVMRVFDRQDARWRFLLWWFVPGFVLISAVSGKLYLYLLPLLPPLAILLGCFIDALAEARIRPGAAFRIEMTAAALLLLGLPAALPFAGRFMPDTPAVHLGILAWIFLPATALCLWAAYTGRVRGALGTLFVGSGLLSAVIFVAIAPQIDAFCSGRTLAREVGRHAAAGRPVATQGLMRGVLNFHAGVETAELARDEVEGFLRDPAAVVVFRGKHLPRHADALRLTGAEVFATYDTVMGPMALAGHREP